LLALANSTVRFLARLAPDTGHHANRTSEFGKPAASLHPDLPHAATATRTPINAELPTPFCCYFSLLLAGGAL